MAVFLDAAEVHHYVGSMFRLAGNHPVVGPKLASADAVLQLVVTGPECELTIGLDHSHRLVLGSCELNPDVTLQISADLLDRYWRGEYDLVRGLAAGEAFATGRVSRVLKVLPHVGLLFPVYRAMTRTGRSPSPRPRAEAAGSATQPGKR